MIEQSGKKIIDVQGVITDRMSRDPIASSIIKSCERNNMSGEDWNLLRLSPFLFGFSTSMITTRKCAISVFTDKGKETYLYTIEYSNPTQKRVYISLERSNTFIPIAPSEDELQLPAPGAVRAPSYYDDFPSASPPQQGRIEATRPSFECSRATTGIELATCASNDLASLDRSLAEAFRDALSRIPQASKKQLQKDQVAWLSNRARSCNLSDGSSKDEWLSPTNLECAKVQYKERISQLQKN